MSKTLISSLIYEDTMDENATQNTKYRLEREKKTVQIDSQTRAKKWLTTRKLDTCGVNASQLISSLVTRVFLSLDNQRKRKTLSSKTL